MGVLVYTAVHSLTSFQKFCLELLGPLIHGKIWYTTLNFRIEKIKMTCLNVSKKNFIRKSIKGIKHC